MTRSPDGVPRGPTEPPGAAPTAPAAEHSEVASPRPAEALDRRSFLRATAGGGAAIALASALPAGTLAAYPAAQRDGVRLQALSPKQYAVARAAAEALLVDVPADPAAVARSMDADLAAVGDPILSDMRTVLTLLEHLTPLALRFRRFTSLGPDDRRAYLMTWAHSRFNLRRAAFQATRGFLYFNTYLREETWGVTGFPGPWPGRFDLPVPPVDFGEIA
jgi:hypothetical protein